MLVRKDASKKMTSDVIAMDGKHLKRTFDTIKEKSALHLLTAFHTALGLVLGQQMVDSKTNEITVIPELLKRLDIRGKTLTLDAMGCQYKICDQIVEQGGDFVIGLKGNQGSVRKACEKRFEYAESQLFDTDIKGQPFICDEVIEEPSSTEHGRIETRRVTTLTPGEHFLNTHPQWKTIQSFVRVISERIIHGVRQTETRFFIASPAPNHVALVRDAIRAHWMIENRLHWSLDTTFREDDSRIRTGTGPHIMAALKRAALGILHNAPSKDSLKIKRQRAGWNLSFLLKSFGFS